MDDANRDGNTTRALVGWAFRHDIDEIFAVVRPGNTRAGATVRRNGMEWVGRPANTSAVAAGVPTPPRRLHPAAATTPPPNPRPSDPSDWLEPEVVNQDGLGPSQH